MDHINLDEAEAFGDLISGYKMLGTSFGHVHRAVFLTWQHITCSACPESIINSIGSESCINQVFC